MSDFIQASHPFKVCPCQKIQIIHQGIFLICLNQVWKFNFQIRRPCLCQSDLRCLPVLLSDVRFPVLTWPVSPKMFPCSAVWCQISDTDMSRLLSDVRYLLDLSNVRSLPVLPSDVKCPILTWPVRCQTLTYFAPIPCSTTPICSKQPTYSLWKKADLRAQRENLYSVEKHVLEKTKLPKLKWRFVLQHSEYI